MNCNEIRGLMPDLAAGLNAVTPEMSAHLRSCAGCAETLEGMRRTMVVLDEWQVAEPSPYFDVRLHARLKEEATKPAVGWLQWFRKPALAVSLAVLMVASVTLFRNGAVNTPAPGPVAVAEPGTAVGDLQALDKNHDLYSDFDVLDDLQVQQDANVNP
jgi:hypothetical protein